MNQTLIGFSYHSVWTTALALAVWSVTGWGTFAPQQSRLIALAPRNASLVIALNHAIIYIGAAVGSVIGGSALSKGIRLDDLHWITAILLTLALLTLAASVRRGKALSGQPVASDR